MCDRDGRALAGVLLVAALCSVAVPRPMLAQASLRDSVQLYEQRLRDASRELEEARGLARGVTDDSISVEGATLLFKGATLPNADRRRLQSAFSRAAVDLTRTFGDQGRTLLAGTRWQLSVRSYSGINTRTFAGLEPLGAGGTVRSGRSFPQFELPLQESMVTELILRHAGELMLQRHPQLAAWLSSGFAFYGRDAVFSFAARELVIHGSVRGRGCARGVLEDCAIILDPARHDEWFDASESRRGLVPASENVRASVLQYAIERGGDGFLEALGSAPGASESADGAAARGAADAPRGMSPVELLARAAKVTPDELLRGWQRELLASGATRAGLSAGRTLTTLAWVLLFAVIATRRRAA